MTVSKPCAVCGEFYDAQRPNSKFCSATCRQRSRRSGGGKPDEPSEDVVAAVTQALAGVAGAASSGDQLATLRALRDTLARQIDSSKDPFGLPALAARLVQVLTEIAKLEPPEQAKGTVVDEIAKRRAARGAVTADQRSAGPRR